VKLRKPPILCSICGDPIVTKWRDKRRQTCGSPECRVAILLEPHLGDRTRPYAGGARGKWKKSTKRGSVVRDLAKWGIGLSEEISTNLADAADQVFKRTKTAKAVGTKKDERGADHPEAQAQIWGFLARRSALIKVVSKDDGEPGLLILKTKSESVPHAIRRLLSITPVSENLCDVFMAWSCPCPQDSRVIYETIDDLPKTVGYHDPCPRCGAAPLEVKNVPKK